VFEADFGTIHQAGTPVRPFRQLAVAGHAPILASAVSRFASGRPGPHVVHAFGAWGWAGLLACRRLARAGIPAASVVGSYTTLADETRSKAEGASASAGRLARLAFGAEHLWILAGVERFERRGYRGAARVLVNYESVRRLLESRFGPGLPIARTPYAPESAFRDAPRLPRPPLPAPVAALAHPGAPLLVSVSRQDPRKGIDVFLRALARLRSEGVAFRACLVGPGPLLESNRAAAARLGLGDRVVLTGLVPEPDDYLSVADVFVLPSRREQSGSLALLEALRLGVAPVVSACDGLPEDVRDGEDAVLVPPGDAAALAAALQRVLGDAGLRRRLSLGARAAFESRFSARPFAAALAEVWDVVAGRA
jgi:glycosyltransferase involved in cell wall biosynthesis